MQYEGDIYRPPSEAHSLIVQVTVGCSHNGCTFCYMYKDKKFKLKPFESVFADLLEARRLYPAVRRVFLADGDALCMGTNQLMRLLAAVRELFPECTRVASYSRASHILNKSDDELASLREAGLGIVYVGAESGSDEVLLRVNKGETAGQIIQAVQKAERSGIQTSVTFISGLGGRELMAEHAVKTAEMISAAGAFYVGLLTLQLSANASICQDIKAGRFEPLEQHEVLDELEMMIAQTNCVSETVLRSNHASNWLALKGTLPQDKGRLLEQIRRAKSDTSVLRADNARRL